MKYTDGEKVKIGDNVIYKHRILSVQCKIIGIQKNNMVKVLTDTGFEHIENINLFKKDNTSIEIGTQINRW